MEYAIGDVLEVRSPSGGEQFVRVVARGNGGWIGLVVDRTGAAYAYLDGWVARYGREAEIVRVLPGLRADPFG